MKAFYDLLPLEAYPWIETGVAGLLALVIALVAYTIIWRVVHRFFRGRPVMAKIVEHVQRPGAWLAAGLALGFVWNAAPAGLRMLTAVQHFTELAVIAAATWVCTRAVGGLSEGIASTHRADVEDNLAARRILTQARVLTRTVIGFVIVVGAASAMMTFPNVRQFGASILASAGVAGLVAGIAARPVLSNLIAGLQIALSQPIRLDDVLVVEGEWGRVEEITGTYVVLRIWDERCLIVPLQRLIEHSFQNWTRSSSKIIGTVFLWVDYAMPLDPLREELQRACRAADEWDGRVCVLQATDATDRAVQLRALVSSIDSPRNWDLRCKVREALIGFVQREYPERFPQLRADVRSPGAKEVQAAAAT